MIDHRVTQDPVEPRLRPLFFEGRPALGHDSEKRSLEDVLGGFPAPEEESYAAIESPNGELGFYLVGDGSEVAYRARCRPPSYIHFSLFPKLIRGHTLSDIVAVLGSLNIIAAELDR